MFSVLTGRHGLALSVADNEQEAFVKRVFDRLDGDLCRGFGVGVVSGPRVTFAGRFGDFAVWAITRNG